MSDVSIVGPSSERKTLLSISAVFIFLFVYAAHYVYIFIKDGLQYDKTVSSNFILCFTSGNSFKNSLYTVNKLFFILLFAQNSLAAQIKKKRECFDESAIF